MLAGHAGPTTMRPSFRSTPTPSTSTSTTSPGFIESFGSRKTPTPSGVPVRIRSPGSSVSARETYAISVGIEKIRLLVRESCSSSPLRR